MTGFNVQEFCKDLKIEPEDKATINDAKKLVELTELICEDAYLARAWFWGTATAMENQVSYLGGNLLPKAERKYNSLTSKGFLGEGDVSVDWYANEDKPHVNDDVTMDDQVIDAEAFIARTKEKMKTAAILFVAMVQAHDDNSKMLDQLTYSAIKAKSSNKRKAGGYSL